MAALKAFSKGSKAYIVDNTWKHATKITECTVKSSGRKYIVVDLGIGENPATFRESDDLTDYLLEVASIGWKRLLFPTEDAAKEYLELLDLRDYVEKAARYPHIKEYSLKQLRAVRAIFEEK